MDTELKCPIETTLSLISGKWKLLIMKELIKEPVRYGTLKSKIPKVSAKVLTQQLKEMETDGVVIRTIYAEVPARVEYSLSPMGKSMLKILREMAAWGLKNDKVHANKCEQCKQCNFIQD